MKHRNSLGLLIAIVGIVALPDTASAYLKPKIGRWLSRDPIGEPGAMLLARVQAKGYLPRQDIELPGMPMIANSRPASAFLPRDPNLSQNGRVIVGHATCHEDGRCEYQLLVAGSAVETPEELGVHEEFNVYQYALNAPTNLIDPLGLSVKCGKRCCLCSKKGTRCVNVYGNSRRAKAIIEAGFGKGAQGCVTLLNWFAGGAEIYCTGSCADIKKWKAGPGVPILDHECCHACAYFDKGVCKYLDGAINDDCTKRARGGFETW